MIARSRGQAGYTLIEVLVSLTIASVILGAAVTGFVSYLGQSAIAQKGANAADGARLALDQMTIQLRGATASPVGNQPIEAFSGYALIWLAPKPSANLSSNPLGLQHVRYCLETSNPGDEKLWLQTSPYNSTSNSNWPDAGLCPSSAWATQLQVASNFVNQQQSKPLFVTPTDPQGNVTDVKIDALVDADPNDAPPATELRSSVTLRNLNHTPTSALTCQAGQNGHALCDASASTDPDNQALAFSWKVDGTTVAETSYQLDQPSLASGSTHTFTVTVTDPGGLTANTSRTLTMP